MCEVCSFSGLVLCAVPQSSLKQKLHYYILCNITSSLKCSHKGTCFPVCAWMRQSPADASPSSERAPFKTPLPLENHYYNSPPSHTDTYTRFHDQWMCTLLADGEVPPMRCCAISFSLNGFYDDVLVQAKTCHLTTVTFEKRLGLSLHRLWICWALLPHKGNMSLNLLLFSASLQPASESYVTWLWGWSSKSSATEMWFVFSFHLKLGSSIRTVFHSFWVMSQQGLHCN